MGARIGNKLMIMLHPFMNPERQMQMAQHRAECAMARAIPYAEFKLPRTASDVGIIAGSFNPDNPLTDIFPDAPTVEGRNTEDMLRSPDGSLAYCLRVLPKGTGLAISSAVDLYSDDGRAYFTEDIAIPTLMFRDETVRCGWTPWMSLTPFELKSQQSGIRAATKHVVLGGLGMGWLMRQIAAKPTVKSITVVEKDDNLIDWFGQRLCDETPKVSIMHGDIWNVARDFDKDCRFILDIWPNHGGASWDRNLQELRDDGYRCWAWGSPRGKRGQR